MTAPAFDRFPMNPVALHERFMRHALGLAAQASEEGEVPVGAVVVHDGRVVGEGYNRREQLNDPTAHAEILAITQASTTLSSWRLEDCTIYATLEPCPMCAGAIVQGRIPHVVYGTDDAKAGACRSLFEITSDSRLNHRCSITPGVLQAECREILQAFFRARRAEGKK